MTGVDSGLIPENEQQRLEAIRRYEILDTPPDGAFDRVTALAARHFGVPISIVSIVDSERIWFKSHHGVDVDEIGRDPGLCASAILQDDAWVVENAAVDPRTLANPLVAGDFGLRFYAGVPLTTQDGFNLGTLCLLDIEPRELSEQDTATLADMAAIVMDELELRLSARTVVDREHALRDQAERTAAALQRGLLPDALPEIPGAEVAALYQPADAAVVGGDFYDVLPLETGGWAIVLGDVSGKGPEAAAVTAQVRHTVRTALLSTDEPAEVLGVLNRAMAIGRYGNDVAHFCTVHLSVLQAAGAGFTVRTAAAGHPHALHVRSGGTVAPLPTAGPPVGWHRDAEFTTTQTELAPGDALLAYTDGLSEARRAGEMLGEGALTDLLDRSRGLSAEAIVGRLRETLAADDVQVRDDAAAIAITVEPA